MKPQRKRAEPILLGAPSPSLARMKKMSSVDLTTQVERLTTEAARLSAKIDRLIAHKPSPVDRVAKLKVQLERLFALKKSAQEQIVGKDERRALRQNMGNVNGNTNQQPPQRRY